LQRATPEVDYQMRDNQRLLEDKVTDMTHNGTVDINKNENLNQRKLVLHFDIRNTLIVADTVTSITVEQALNAYLTGVLWGRASENNQWEWKSKAPSLNAPEPVSQPLYYSIYYWLLDSLCNSTKCFIFIHNLYTKFGFVLVPSFITDLRPEIEVSTNTFCQIKMQKMFNNFSKKLCLSLT